MIPQLKPNYNEQTADALKNYILNDGYITEYKKTEEFENNFKKFLNTNYAIATTSGTCALLLSLLAIDIKKNDEIIVTDLSIVASATPIKLLGGIPKFIDIDINTGIMRDLNDNDFTDKTKAVIYVSLNGRAHNIYNIKNLCKKHNCILIEDAAQSLGSKTIKNDFIGSIGDINCFSLSSPKIISTGQGGIITTNNKTYNDKIRMLKNFGREIKYNNYSIVGTDICPIIGYNFKFTDLQAIVGLEQMKILNERIKRKKEIWDIYYSQLSHIKEIKMIEYQNGWIPFSIDIYIKKRNELAKYLKQNDIGSRFPYLPIHSQQGFKEYNYLSYPNSTNFSKEGLWLPSYPELKNNEIEYICKTIINFFDE